MYVCQEFESWVFSVSFYIVLSSYYEWVIICLRLCCCIIKAAKCPHSLFYTTSVCHAVLKRLFPMSNRHGRTQGKACWHFLHFTTISSHQTLLIHVQPSPSVAFDTINVDWRSRQIEVMTVNLHRCLTSFWVPLASLRHDHDKRLAGILFLITLHGHGIVDLQHKITKVSDLWLE